MITSWKLHLAGCLALLATCSAAQAQGSMNAATIGVNKKMVKLFGIGGFKGLPSYGTGLVVSGKGHILTVNNHILNTPGILVHLYDGRQYQAKVLVREPELDVALLKIDEDVNLLNYFDFEKEAERPVAENGDWILAFSNQFRIAMRDEPMSVQRGVVMALADLRGRRGIFDAPFQGDAYFLDVVACNPGAAGGALTNRKGELLGILGRELKSNQTDTWINYAVPIQAVVDVVREDKEGKTRNEKVSMATFVRDAMKGNYQTSVKKKFEDRGAYHGITLVVSPGGVPTPPYVEEVIAGSPAAKAGLQPDDLILYVEGYSVPTVKAFRETVRQYDPGKEISLQFQRGNKLENVRLTLSKQPTPASK